MLFAEREAKQSETIALSQHRIEHLEARIVEQKEGLLECRGAGAHRQTREFYEGTTPFRGKRC